MTRHPLTSRRGREREKGQERGSLEPSSYPFSFQFFLFLNPSSTSSGQLLPSLASLLPPLSREIVCGGTCTGKKEGRVERDEVEKDGGREKVVEHGRIVGGATELVERQEG